MSDVAALAGAVLATQARLAGVVDVLTRLFSKTGAFIPGPSSCSRSSFLGLLHSVGFDLPGGSGLSMRVAVCKRRSSWHLGIYLYVYVILRARIRVRA